MKHGPLDDEISFHTSEPSKCVMRIDGSRIWVNPDIEVDEAARKVLEAMSLFLGEWERQIQQREREACALVAEDMCEYGKPFSAAAAIRARGDHA